MEIKEHEGGALSYLTVEPDGYDAGGRYPLVVLLHGYGSHMGDLAGLCSAVSSDGYVYALPNAPVPIQVGFGAVGYAWIEPPGSTDAEVAKDSQERLERFFEEIIDRYSVGPAQAVLGGFSQGGMMSYHCGLPMPEVFRGVAALSARVPDPDALQERLPEDRGQSIFISHGTVDSIIPVEEGRRSRRFLEDNGYSPEYVEYQMAHEINESVLADLTRWLHQALPPAGG